MELAASAETSLFGHTLARLLITPNRQGAMCMFDEVLSSVGAQDMDTSWYQVSALENIEFHWKYLDLNKDTTIRPDTNTPFSPSTFNDFEIGSLAEKPIPNEEGEDKKKSPPLQSNPASQQLNEPPEETFLTIFIKITLKDYFKYCVCEFLKLIYQKVSC